MVSRMSIGPLPFFPSLAASEEEERVEEKQHSCSMCDFKSLYKANVGRHERKMHGRGESLR